MKRIVLHIPHSSITIPHYDGFIVDNNVINNEILIQTDWYTDDLFDAKNEIIIKAEFSRIFCDPERFLNDKKEIMSKIGMGVIYTTTDSGKVMRIINSDLRKEIISEFYMKHHQKLTDAVSLQLKANNIALIIDCHSFPNEPLIRDINKQPNRPDICIGTDSFHTPEKIVDFSIDFFLRKGYTIDINSPYAGTIIPLKYLHKDKRVFSIMIEVNRKLYLEKFSNTKSKDFFKIHQTISEYLEKIKNCL